jgi:putative tricarboxylic transport membrane protein
VDVLGHLANGFAAALTPMNLSMAVLGSLLGTLVGVLPGLGPTAAIAILFPLTAVLTPAPAIIMLAAIYYGAMYGGSTTAILLNIPGEVASVPTALDGYPMAREGRGGVALGIAAIGSFVAGTFGVLALTFFAPLLADQALRFGPPEYFGLMVLAFTVVVSLSGASLTKGLAMAMLGYLISLIGLGPSTAEPRFTFGYGPLMSGVDLIALVVGLFAISEVFLGLEEARVAIATKIRNVFPRWADLRQALPAIARGTGIGFLLGLLPGCAPGVTVFLAYDVEKKLSRQPERFGKGAIEGVASPESANNATSSAGFIPLLGLGIPASAPLAILLGGLMVYGLQPGPLLFQKNPDFVWTVIASLYIGNVILLGPEPAPDRDVGLAHARPVRHPGTDDPAAVIRGRLLGPHQHVRRRGEPDLRRPGLSPAQVPVAARAAAPRLHPGSAARDLPARVAVDERWEPAHLRPARALARPDAVCGRSPRHVARPRPLRKPAGEGDDGGGDGPVMNPDHQRRRT